MPGHHIAFLNSVLLKLLPGVPGMRSAALLFMLSLGASFLLAGCGKSDTAGAQPQAPTVSVSEVVQREVIEWDEFTGHVEAVEKVEVRARVSGYLERVNFKDGAIVKQGDVLFVIDPRPFQAEVNRLQGELVRAQTRLELAKNDAARAQRLLKSKAISEEEADSRAKGESEGVAAVKAASAALEAARLNLEFTTVNAPISGRADRALITRGNLIQGGAVGSTLLTTIVSLDPVYVYFDGDERTYLKYGKLAREGKRVSSREGRNPVLMGLVTEEGYPHEGYIDFVQNVIDPTTGTIQGRAVFENKQQIFTPGLFARIRLLGSGKYPAVQINDRAVGTDQGQKFVFVVNDKNATEYRAIKLGPIVEGLRVVREGLKPGERIVVNGLQRVRPGMQITPQMVSMTGLDSAAGSPPAPAPPQAPDKGKSNPVAAKKQAG